jgi:hypothetical protein
MDEAMENIRIVKERLDNALGPGPFKPVPPGTSSELLGRALEILKTRTIGHPD